MADHGDNSTEKNGGSELLTVTQAIALLSVSRTTLYRMIDEGSLKPVGYNPALKRPKRHLFKREDVERILREGRQPKTKD